MSIHLTIKEPEPPQSENCNAQEKRAFFSQVVELQGNNLFCGWKQGISWGEKFSEKGSVKQATPLQALQGGQLMLNLQSNSFFFYLHHPLAKVIMSELFTQV